MIPRIREVSGCEFCCDESELTIKAPLNCKDSVKPLVSCDRWLYKDNYCIVTLNPIQLSMGHAIAILWNHSDDITDGSLLNEEHHALINAVRHVACSIKQKLLCERVYVATLCDGVKHLHYHIIPRYQTDTSGFAFVGQREFAHQNGYWIGPEPEKARVDYLEKIARMIRSNC
jgi:diadenosine tetraphosphate (Ap4A) HIT family hydrolase